MRTYRFRGKILQWLYRPSSARPPFVSGQTMAELDEIDQMIEKKITPLLSGLWRD